MLETDNSSTLIIDFNWQKVKFYLRISMNRDLVCGTDNFDIPSCVGSENAQHFKTPKLIEISLKTKNYAM